MADLYNLLDEIDEPQEQPFQQQDDELSDTEEQLPRDREQVELPALDKPLTHIADEDERVDLEDLATEKSLADLPYTKLQHLWTQEIHSPELLPYDDETIRGMTEAVQQQEDDMEHTLQQTTDTTASSADGNMNALVQSIKKIDTNRVKFLLADTLRARLQKLEEHPLHNRTLVDRMSENEAEYLKEYGALLERHLNRTVLEHFPQQAWKKLDEPEMIDEPDLGAYVFIKTKENVAFDNGTADNPDLQQFAEGTCLIVRYNRIRELFLNNQVEFLM